MEGACRHCGGEHAELECPLLQSAELEAISIRTRSAAHPASKPFRDCRAQLRLALTQREEDPARVWLELVSIRESASKLPDLAADDPMLKQDIDRFRAKLEAEIFQLTEEVDDEVLAPLYLWVDLIRRRNRLDREIVNARESVKASRAARRDKTRAPRTVDEAQEQLERAEEDLALWQSSVPAPPSQAELAIWDAGGWSTKRDQLPQDGPTAHRRGSAARARLSGLGPAHVLGKSEYAGSPVEKLLVGGVGGAALLFTVLAIAVGGAGIVALALLGWLGAGAAVGYGAYARKRAAEELSLVIDAVWYHTLYSEQAQVMEIEVGWLRALLDAFRARRAFDEAKAEGKQIEELKAWRPDLRDFVVEVAKQGDAAAQALANSGSSMAPPYA